MYKIYCIINIISRSIYIGQTSSSVERRFYEHNLNAFSYNKKTKLYDAMRKYDAENFEVIELECSETKTQINALEIEYINVCKHIGINLYNMTNGGDGGFVVPEHKIDEWKLKLSQSRQGKTPALGMKHTDENKQLFSEVSNKYWDEHRKYTAQDIISAGSFALAKELYGISKTHYYRLIKRVLPN